MKERVKLTPFSNVENFPFVKLYKKDGTAIPAAFKQFTHFVHRRIDEKLFENEEVVQRAIKYGGGSPRQLLKILELAAFFANEEKGTIDMAALNEALVRFANQMAAHMTEEMIEKIKEILEYNRKNKPVSFDDVIDDMLEKELLMEYNTGNYKRPNPLIELSDLYKDRIVEV